MSQAAKAQTAYHHGDLRRALVDRAIATIETGGVEAVSLRALAREIGVSHAAPMRHFPTKSALLAAIAQHGVESLLASAMRDSDDPALTHLEKLRAMAVGYVRWADENPVHHLLIRNQDVMRHADDDLVERINRYARLHEETIARAQAAGWRRNEDTRALFVRLTAMTAGLALVASDPIYRTVFQERLSTADIDAALADFLGEP